MYMSNFFQVPRVTKPSFTNSELLKASSMRARDECTEHAKQTLQAPGQRHRVQHFLSNYGVGIFNQLGEPNLSFVPPRQAPEPRDHGRRSLVRMLPKADLYPEIKHAPRPWCA